MYPFLLRIPWYRYVFLYKYHTNSFSKYWNRFQNRDFSYPDCITWSGFGIFKQNWDSWTVCDSIQYYQKKGRRQFILLRHSLEFYNFLVRCLCFLVESIPKRKLLKGLHATTETMQLSETSVVCRPHALIVWVIHLSPH